MPAQKRNSSSSVENSGESPHRRKRDDEEERESQPLDEDDDTEEEEEDDENEEDSDGSSHSSDDVANQSEWILVELPGLRTDVQCPICLGIIKNTRTVMECLHRFCRECIDKSMRLGNNECPACRTHCASRRSLRDDPHYDALIDIIYEDIERYEAEELAFHEEEKNRNKQIQESIAHVSQLQSEALLNKRKRRKEKALPKYRDSYPRRRRRTTRGESHDESEENEDENNHVGNGDSSEDERETEIIKPRRYKRKARGQPSSSAANSDLNVIENNLEASKGSNGSPMRTAEMLAWGRGGARSKNVRNTRIMKLTRYLERQKENDDEHLAQETLVPAEDIEIPVVQEHEHLNENHNTLEPQVLTETKGALQILEGNEALAGVPENCAQEQNNLVLAYQLKERC